MNADLFGVIAVVGFGLAVVFAVAAAAYGVTHHVREVRDELTGRAAARAIEELRSGHRAMSAAASAASGGRVPGVQSGSLQVRHGATSIPLTAEAPTAVRESKAALSDDGAEGDSSEAGTTLLGAIGKKGVSESGTAAEEGTSELGTTLLAGKGSAPASEAGTTLLGAEEPATASEEHTTLLQGLVSAQGEPASEFVTARLGKKEGE